MKKFVIVCAFFSCLQVAKAQESSATTLNIYGSYLFKDKVNFDGFTGHAGEGLQYGGGLEYYFETTRSLELKYLRQNTRFPLYSPAGKQLNEGKDEGSVNYILFGATNYVQLSPTSMILPYGGLSLGVGILDLHSGKSTVDFGWDAKLGLQIKTPSKISIKLQATLQSIVSAVGQDFYQSSIGAVVMPDYATLLQFGLGGGLSYNF